MVSKVKQFNQGEWYQALQPTPVNEHRSAASGDLAIFVEEADDEVLVLIEGSQFRIKRELFLANFVKVEDGEARLNRQINDLISTGQELAAEIKAAESQFSKIQNAFQLRGQADPDSVPPTTENERAELIILRQDLIVRKMGEEIARQRDLLNERADRIAEIKSAIQRLLSQKTALANFLLSFTDFTEKISTVLTTLNLYLGTGEEILQLKQGKWAAEDAKLTIRQLVLQMDEESLIASETGGMDFNDLTEFDEWLLSDEKHLRQILPEEKGIVCLKPRRTEKSYSDDPIVNYMVNQRNFATYFLIRNGENLFRVSPSWSIGEKLFPSRREFELLESKEKEARRLALGYRQTLTLIQGIVDRTGIFPELARRGVNLLAMEENFELVNYVYDADESNLIGTGREPFPKFRKQINSQLGAGDRFIGVFPWKWDDYCRSSKKGVRPPGNVIYTIEEAAGKQLFFKFEGPDIYRYDETKGYFDYCPPKKRISAYVTQDDDFILAYDLVSAQELEDFLLDRVARRDYADLIPFLKKLKQLKLKEEQEEFPFIQLCAGRFASIDDSQPMAVFFQRARELVNWWKFKTKQTRLITDDDAKAWRMIEAEYKVRFTTRAETDLETDAAASLVREDTLWLGKQGSRYIRWSPVNEERVFIKAEKFVWKKGDFVKIREEAAFVPKTLPKTLNSIYFNPALKDYPNGVEADLWTSETEEKAVSQIKNNVGKVLAMSKIIPGMKRILGISARHQTAWRNSHYSRFLKLYFYGIDEGNYLTPRIFSLSLVGYNRRQFEQCSRSVRERLLPVTDDLFFDFYQESRETSYSSEATVPVQAFLSEFGDLFGEKCRFDHWKSEKFLWFDPAAVGKCRRELELLKSYNEKVKSIFRKFEAQAEFCQKEIDRQLEAQALDLYLKNFGDPRNWEAYKKGRKNAVEFVKDVFNAPFNLLGTKFLHGELTAAGLLHLNISKVIQIFDKNRSEPFERPEVLPLLVDTFFNEKELSQLAQWREEAKVLKSQLTRKFWSSGSNK